MSSILFSLVHDPTLLLFLAVSAAAAAALVRLAKAPERRARVRVAVVYSAVVLGLCVASVLPYYLIEHPGTFSVDVLTGYVALAVVAAPWLCLGLFAADTVLRKGWAAFSRLTARRG